MNIVDSVDSVDMVDLVDSVDLVDLVDGVDLVDVHCKHCGSVMTVCSGWETYLDDDYEDIFKVVYYLCLECGEPFEKKRSYLGERQLCLF